MNARTLILFAALASPGVAAPRTSASYTIISDTNDGGGQRSAGGNYFVDASFAQVAGKSDAARAQNDSGWDALFGTIFVGPIIGTAVGLPIGGVPERGSVNLTLWGLLDDDTYFRIAPQEFDWGLAVEPIVSITDDGKVTTGSVFVTTSATVSASFAGFTAEAELPVLNITSDDFGNYSGDGLDDAWQVQHFGEDNPFAAPGMDADGDGQNNLLEFRAGYAPNDAHSLFAAEAAGFDGADFVLRLSRVQPGTRYVFQRTTDFATWTDVFTLDPVAVIAPFERPLPTAGAASFFRVRLEAAP